MLLRNIARDLVPGMLKCGQLLQLRGDDLRSVDRAFAAWPVRHATPSSIGFYPEDDKQDAPASVDFYWEVLCDGCVYDENTVFTSTRG